MKIRKGFVSNSSSTSFIVKFPFQPRNAEEVKKIVFGDDEWFMDPYYDPKSSFFKNRTEKYSTKEVAEDLYKDIESQIANDFKILKKTESLSKEELKELRNMLRGSEVLYHFTFSDEDGQYQCALEHGIVFEKLEGKRFSHH